VSDRLSFLPVLSSVRGSAIMPGQQETLSFEILQLPHAPLAAYRAAKFVVAPACLKIFAIERVSVGGYVLPTLGTWYELPKVACGGTVVEADVHNISEAPEQFYGGFIMASDIEHGRLCDIKHSPSSEWKIDTAVDCGSMTFVVSDGQRAFAAVERDAKWLHAAFDARDAFIDTVRKISEMNGDGASIKIALKMALTKLEETVS
jgi:hypothetical protein